MRRVIGFSSSAVRNTFSGAACASLRESATSSVRPLARSAEQTLATAPPCQRKDQTILACERGGEDDELGVGELHGSLRGIGRAPDRPCSSTRPRSGTRAVRGPDRSQEILDAQPRLFEQRFVHAHKTGKVSSRARGQARIQHDVQVIHCPVGTP